MRTRQIKRATFDAIADRTVPCLRKAERLLRPRLEWVDQDWIQPSVGGVCLLLSIIVLLPIPLGNMLPAMAICVMALGLLENDGAWIVGGLIVAVASTGVVWGVIYAGVKVAALLIIQAIGALS